MNPYGLHNLHLWPLTWHTYEASFWLVPIYILPMAISKRPQGISRELYKLIKAPGRHSAHCLHSASECSPSSVWAPAAQDCFWRKVVDGVCQKFICFYLFPHFKLFLPVRNSFISIYFSHFELFLPTNCQKFVRFYLFLSIFSLRTLSSHKHSSS